MKHTLALAALALLLGTRLPGSEPAGPGVLTLSQALDAVLSRYPTLDAAQAAVDSARGQSLQTGSARLPQVSLEGSYRYGSLRPYAKFPGAGGGVTFYPSIQNSYDAGLHIRQLLTDFGRTDALVDLARTGEMSARDALEQVRSQLGYEAIQAFYGVILLRESAAVADEELRALEEAVRIAQRKAAGGTATRFDVLTTQVRLATSQNSRTDIQASLEKQEAVLRQLLGLEPAAPLNPGGDFTVPAGMPDLPSAIAEGLKNRPEMRLARDSEESAGLKIRAADLERRPVLSAQASGGLQDGNLPDMYSNKGYAAAGLAVSVPLFTGSRIDGERVEARAGLRAAQDRVGELDRTIATDVESAYSDLKAARARLANADTLVAQAQEALALAKSRYANGVITTFELLDAQSSARAAELARLQARYDCVLAGQALARAAGRPPRPEPQAN